MINLIAVAVGVYSALVGAMYLFQRELIYHPSQWLPEPAESGLPEMRPVRLNTEDGLRLTSWYRPAARGLPTIVFFQGNGGNIAGRGFKVRPYLDAGFGLLLTGYRGYGGNPGTPNEQGLYADGRAGLRFLGGEGVVPALWVLYGESLGGGIAVELAREQASSGRPVGAVVLEAPFTSMGDAAAAHYPFVPSRTLVKDRFDSIAKISQIKAPVLVIHGELDSVIPQKQGKKMFEAAREPRKSHWVKGAGHNDLHEFGLSGFVIEFIGEVIAKAN